MDKQKEREPTEQEMGRLRELVPTLARRTRVLLGHRADHALVDDIVQETLLIALDSVRSLRDPAAFDGWVLGILRNRIRQHFQRIERRRESPPNDGLSSDLEDSIVTSSPEQRVAAAQRVAILVRELPARLSPQQREIFPLYFEEERTPREIGGLLGCSVAVVSVQVSRIRKLADAIRQEFLCDELQGETSKTPPLELRTGTASLAPVRKENNGRRRNGPARRLENEPP